MQHFVRPNTVNHRTRRGNDKRFTLGSDGERSVYTNLLRKIIVEMSGSRAYTAGVNYSAYAYWFRFWDPHTIGRGANL